MRIIVDTNVLVYATSFSSTSTRILADVRRFCYLEHSVQDGRVRRDGPQVLERAGDPR